MKKNIKFATAFVAMVSLGASSFTTLAGFQDTVFEWNAYVQGGVAVVIFLYLVHRAIGATEVKIQKQPTNKRDSK